MKIISQHKNIKYGQVDNKNLIHLQYIYIAIYKSAV